MSLPDAVSTLRFRISRADDAQLLSAMSRMPADVGE